MVIVEWAIAISLFWLVAALFLGGGPIRIHGGGGPRQLLGLLLVFAAFLAVWKLLVAGLTGLIPVRFLAVVVASLVASGLVPPLCWALFRPLGVRIELGREEH